MDIRINGHEAETKKEKEIVDRLKEVLATKSELSMNGNFRGVHISFENGRVEADNGIETLIITWT
jgi:vacuolar-type H+-ATPase subunit E/Vma4